MLKKHAIYLLDNNIDLYKLNYLRGSTALKWFDTLDGLTKTDNGYEFYPPAINTENNKKKLHEVYERFRLIYGLKAKKVLPTKAVSCVVVRISKLLGYNVHNKRKFKRVDANTTTTVGFYTLSKPC